MDVTYFVRHVLNVDSGGLSCLNDAAIGLHDKQQWLSGPHLKHDVFGRILIGH